MKLLLLGKGGQVGWELQRSLAPLGELIALDFDSTDFHADFSRPEQLAETVLKVRPDVIVNAAAHTAVDKAESEPEFARKLERELGWKPAETFDTGIRKTVEWYLANGDWVSNVQSGAYREWVEKQYDAAPAKASA